MSQLVPPLTADDLTIQTDPHEFEKLATALASDLDGEDAQLAALEPLLAGDTVLATLDTIDSELGQIGLTIDNELGVSLDGALAGTAGQFTSGDNLINTASGAIPPSGSIPTIVVPPNVPGGGGGTTPPGGGGTTPPGVIRPGPPQRPPRHRVPTIAAPAPQFGAFIENLDRPGDLNFRVGDHARVTIRTPNGAAPISVTGTRDGAALGLTPEGITDASGLKQIDVTFGAGDRGHWVEQWFAAGELLESNTDFTVE